MCLRMSRNAWMLVSAVFEQNCRTTSPWQNVRLERVVGELVHGDEAGRPQFLQVHSGRRTAKRRSRQSQSSCRERRSVRAELIVRRGVLRVQGRRFAAFREKGDALGQGSKQPLELGAIIGEKVEARDQRRSRLRRRHAGLMEAVKWLAILRAVIARRQRSGRRGMGLRADPEANGAARETSRRSRLASLRPPSALSSREGAARACGLLDRGADFM